MAIFFNVCCFMLIIDTARSRKSLSFYRKQSSIGGNKGSNSFVGRSTSFDESLKFSGMRSGDSESTFYSCNSETDFMSGSSM